MNARTLEDETYFAIISLPRCGSTYLSLKLGLLHDVNSDFEFKYPVADRPYVEQRGPVHLFLNEGRYVELVDRYVERARVRGSKIVLDLDPYEEADIRDIFARIERSVPIVFVSRSAPEIVLSLARGAVNLIGPEAGDSELAQHLSNHRPSNPESFKERKLDLRRSEFIRQRVLALETMSTIRDQLSERGNYLEVEYKEIGDRFAEIANFIGSRATPSEIDAVGRIETTQKLGMADQRRYARRFTKLGSIAFLFEGWPFERALLRALNNLL